MARDSLKYREAATDALIRVLKRAGVPENGLLYEEADEIVYNIILSAESEVWEKYELKGKESW